MNHERQKSMTVTCQIDGAQLPLDQAIPVDLIRDGLVETLKKKCPTLDMHGYVSIRELDLARMEHAQELAQRDQDALIDIRKQVADSLMNQEILTKNLDAEFDKSETKGEKIADRVAAFGGSWLFIGIFAVVLFAWMAINTTLILQKPFDPFPYIFLNLILSCLAAIQAPVIMMSQNRQEARDRMRSENDYKTNLKAEVEIQGLNEKIDKLINDQWKHLLEIQQMQMEMIEEFTKRSK